LKKYIGRLTEEAKFMRLLHNIRNKGFSKKLKYTKWRKLAHNEQKWLNFAKRMEDIMYLGQLLDNRLI